MSSSVRVVCISDTHGVHRHCDPLPEGDLLIHGGDFTRYGKVEDLLDFKKWLDEISHRFQHIIIVNGNHEVNAPWQRHTRTILESKHYDHQAFIDLCSDEEDSDSSGQEARDQLGDCFPGAEQDNCDTSQDVQKGVGRCPDTISRVGIDMGHAVDAVEDSFRSNIHFLVNDLIVVNVDCNTDDALARSKHQLNVFGSQFYWPAPPSGKGGFQFNEELGASLHKCLFDPLALRLHILVTHGPCLGIVDRGEGCGLMREMAFKLQPQLVVSGHIHDGHGLLADEERGIIFVNAAICGPSKESRRKGWDAIVVDLPLQSAPA